MLLAIAQIIISVLLVVCVLVQSKGVGLSATFGGEGGFYRSRRGVEKLLFRATILLAALFAITAFFGVIR